MKLETPIVVKLKNDLTGTITDFTKRRLTDQFEGNITGVTDTGETYSRKLKPR